ncbi:unnamed protein product, partial [Mesorhabditis belari]|uniref:Uncharacterized protein n=1 Tax=Mesorhabditis belari TaxID=2138241 RepID=A0AAF3J426_9BILA
MIARLLVKKMTYLHENFRCLVFASCASCLIVTLSLIGFLCSQMLDLPIILHLSTNCYFFGLYGDAFTTIFMSFERGIATLKATSYEEKTNGFFFNLLLFLLPFLAAAIWMFIYDSGIIPLADLSNSLFFSLIAFLCLLETIIIFRFNKRMIVDRGNSNLSLSARFQYTENFSLSKVFLFVTANDLLTWITLAVLYYFASAMESVSLMNSSGNIYLDLGDSVYLEKCLVLYTALFISHRKFENRTRRIRPQPLHLESQLHFSHLAKLWDHHYVS